MRDELKEIKDNEFRWKFAVEGNGDGLWDWDITTNEVYYSSRWKEMLGYDDLEINSTLEEWERLVHKDDLQRVYKVVENHLNGDAEHYNVEIRMLCKSGDYKWILARGMTVNRDDEGRALRIIGTHTDISLQKKISKELTEAKQLAEQANEAKSEFISNMSHEIRTPMNSILGFAELLDEEIEDPKQKSYLNSIRTSGKVLLNIINDILDLSKIESGKMELDLHSVKISRLLNEMDSIFKNTIQEKNLNLQLSISPTLPKNLLLDEHKMRQILINLLGNAIKFTSDGTIEINVNEKYHEITGLYTVYFIVKDSGIGIPQKKLEHIFESFTQSDSSTTRNYGGTGLGLSICSKMARLMNGEISVESKEGEGSEFTITLYDIETTQDKNAESETKVDIEFEESTVLLVDDVKYNRDLAKAYLSQNVNVNIIEASDGYEAVDLCKEIKFDLILMDIRMPNLDGIEATKIIKEIDLNKETPSIVLTASVFKQELDKLKDLFDGYIRKPVSKKGLLLEISKYLKSKRTLEIDSETNYIEVKENRKDLADIYEQLSANIDTDIASYIDNLKSLGDFEAINDFIKKIQILNIGKKIPYINSLSMEISTAIEIFDIEKAFECLDKINELFSYSKEERENK